MSPKQISTLRHFFMNDRSIDGLRKLHQGTFWSLLHRGYLVRQKDLIVITQLGIDTLRAFDSQKPNERKHEAAITERNLRLLHYVREFRKAS